MENSSEEEEEDSGFIDPMGIADRIAETHIAIEKKLKNSNARLNIHKYVREFLIVLVKIAQKHAKENPQSDLAGLGLMLIPMATPIIDTIVKEVQSDPEDLVRLIEYFYEKLKRDGFFDEEVEKSEDTKEE